MAESAAIPNKQKGYDFVTSKRKPTKGCAKAAPKFMHIPVMPNPTLAKVGPKISAGKADAMGGTMAAVTPRARIEATKAMLEVYAEATNASVIRREPATAKGLRLPVLSDSQPKMGTQNIAPNISKLAKKLA